MHYIDIVLIAILTLLLVLAVRHILKKPAACCGDCTTCHRNCVQHKNG